MTAQAVPGTPDSFAGISTQLKIISREKSASEQPRKRFRGRAVTATITSLALSLVGFAAAQPALAHDQLVSNTPAAGEALTTAPTEIILQFNNSVLDVGTLIEVTNAQDEQVQQGEPTIHERTVTQPLKADLPEDAYTVTWRVVSSDGHPISGTFEFAVGEAPKTASDKPEQSGAATPGANDSAAQEESDSSAEDSADGPGWGRPALVAAIGAIVAIGGYIFMIRSSKRKK